MANHWILKAGQIATDTLCSEVFRLRQQHRAVSPDAPLREATPWLHDTLRWCLSHRGVRRELLALMGGSFARARVADADAVVDRFCRPVTVGELAEVVRVLSWEVPGSCCFWVEPEPVLP